MTFWDHLEELRGTLVRSLLAVILIMIAGLAFRDFLFSEIILRPAGNLQVVNLEISGQFMVHMRCAMMLGLVGAFPYILWEIWKFIAPALYPHEKKGAVKAFLLGSILFYTGVAIGYFILMPVCLAFFQSYSVSDSITNTFSLQSYISLFGSMVILIGLVFEFPMLIMLLSSMGIVTRSMLRKGRKYAIVAVGVVAALITPSDIGSMLIAGVPLYGLYELSIWFCKEPQDKEGEDKE